MSEASLDPLVAQIKTALAQLLEGTPVESLTDTDLVSLDSIGRLSLIVELENIFETELMGDDMSPDCFDSFSKLAGYVVKRRGA